MPFDTTTIEVLKDGSVTPDNPSGDLITYPITMSQLEHIRLATSDPIPLESVVLNVISTYG